MGQNTNIEWTDATWNPVTGCSKVSPGCAHCYAERDFHRPYPWRDFGDVRTHPERLDWPLRWRGSKQAKAEGRPSKIFVNSMSDLFHDIIPVVFLDKCFAVMALASGHTFQVLTKRPERMKNYLDLSCVTGLGLPVSMSASARIARCAQRIAVQRGEKTDGAYWDLFLEPPYRNIWLGVSVENQKTADERIPLLLQTPAAVRFVSYEPALGPVNFWPFFSWRKGEGEGARRSLDWVIAGGESGPKARPSHPDWFRTVRDQCLDVGVPFFFKQWGKWTIASSPNTSRQLVSFGSPFGGIDSVYMERVGRKLAGRLLDGREWNEFPACSFYESDCDYGEENESIDLDSESE